MVNSIWILERSRLDATTLGNPRGLRTLVILSIEEDPSSQTLQ